MLKTEITQKVNAIQFNSNWQEILNLVGEDKFILQRGKVFIEVESGTLERVNVGDWVTVCLDENDNATDRFNVFSNENFEQRSDYSNGELD